MRIITGKAKGLKLKSPKGMDTRPTADRIKESLFNILSNRIEFYDCKVLDLFAGTGALGLEAMSRGASNCKFIDKSTSTIIKENIIRAKFETCTEVINGDVFNNLNGEYDIIFCDPPYNKGLWQRALKLIDERNILSVNGVLIIEHGIDENFFEQLTKLELLKRIEYGKTTAIEIFKRSI